MRSQIEDFRLQTTASALSNRRSACSWLVRDGLSSHLPFSDGGNPQLVTARGIPTPLLRRSILQSIEWFAKGASVLHQSALHESVTESEDAPCFG